MKHYIYYLTILPNEWSSIFQALFDGIPNPSNRTSNPPMLRKWFWLRVLSANNSWRVLRVKYCSERSVHWSFMLKRLRTRNSSASQFSKNNKMITANVTTSKEFWYYSLCYNSEKLIHKKHNIKESINKNKTEISPAFTFSLSNETLIFPYQLKEFISFVWLSNTNDGWIILN